MYEYFLEFLGTLFVVYVALATGNPLAIGASYALILLLTKGFLNPAVVIAMASAGQISTASIIPYIVSEILGALVALELFKRVKF